MKDITGLVVIIFAIASLIYLFFEQIILKKIRKSFKIVIHVNGTRGKSTVSRYMDAIMRQAGYKTFSKTTGTIPIIIHVDGLEERIKRLGRANIREQAIMMMKAYREQAEVLILECMAVEPVLQWHSEHHMIHADINIITNLRHDHTKQMGNTLEEIAASIANTVQNKTIVVTGDRQNASIIEQAVIKKGASFIFAQAKANSYSLMQENENVAIKAAEILGISEEIAKEGIKNHVPDFGAFKTISIGDLSFINALSANDPDSTIALYDEVKNQNLNQQITLLVNNRWDRPERTKQNIELIKHIKPHRVYIAGDNAHYVSRKIKTITEVKFYSKMEDLLNEKMVFAFGNIGQQGFKILQACEQWRNNHGN